MVASGGLAIVLTDATKLAVAWRFRPDARVMADEVGNIS
jgi:hypothetical protein